MIPFNSGNEAPNTFPYPLKKIPFLGVFGFRLFLTFALLSTLLVTVIGIIGYTQSRKSLIRNAAENLTCIANDRAREINNWFDERIREISLITELPQVKELSSQSIQPDDPHSDGSSVLAYILSIYNKPFDSYGYYSFCDLDGFSIFQSEDFPFTRNEVASLPEFQSALRCDSTVLGYSQQLKNGDTGITLTKAITDAAGEPIAVFIIMFLPGKVLNDILLRQTGLGETGETYLVGADSTALTPLRFGQDSVGMTEKITTEGTLNCLAGNDSIRTYKNYAGDEVLGASVYLPRQGWALLSEMNKEEVLKPLGKIKSQLLIVVITALLIVLGISVFVSRRLTRPLYQLASASQQIAAGSLDVEIDPDTIDEIGYLAAHFNHMADALKDSRQQVESSTVKLLQAEKLAVIGKLVASIVHEMRNPLSSVKMNLQILGKKTDLDELSAEHLEIASEQAIRLEKMLNELLEYSKPVMPNFEPIQINDLMNSVRKLVSVRLEEKQLKLVEEGFASDLELRSDPDLLSRIFDNIISNAMEASSPGGIITIRIASDTPLRVEVIDNGKGMSEKVLDQIFEPFFTTRGEGVGLGMSNVKKFIEAIEAEIEVQSVEGEGTTFTITFPKDIASTHSIDKIM